MLITATADAVFACTAYLISTVVIVSAVSTSSDLLPKLDVLR